MRTGRRFRGWVIAAAVGGGASALAQSPAARLVPIDPNKAPAAPVVRSAYPDIPDADVYQVPVQGYAGQPRPTAPQPERSRTWVGGAWSGVKEFVVGKPTSAEMPPAAPPSARLPQPRQVPPAPAPQPRQPEPQPAAPQPGVYAGPPAYRWYGWGSTTPGANQYAPHGLYPKGSANWHSHTGATPGAFPVPVQYPAGTPGVEPPVYAGNPNGYDAAYLARTRGAEPEPVLEPSFDPRRQPRTAVAPPTVEPPPGLPAAPSVPRGQPMPLPSTPVASGPDARQPELNWQTVGPASGSSQTLPPAPLPRPPQPSPSDPQWVPAATQNYPGTVVPVAHTAAPVARGQQPAETPDVTALIRAACFSRVNQVRVIETEKGTLTVTFVTTTEQLAREAAAVVSKLPELRPYEVRFEVQLTK